jgi:hypothetical protein
MMMRWVLVTALVVAWGVPAGAGEVVLKNGKRLRADLVGHLILSTGSDLLEFGSEQVVEVTPEAVRLSDGRTVRGTLVGGQLRARTEFGQLTIPLDDLDVFRAAAPAPSPPPPSPPPAVASPPAAPPREGQTEKGIGRTVSEGAGRIHDGFKAFGLAIWDGMKEVGRTVERAFGE